VLCLRGGEGGIRIGGYENGKGFKDSDLGGI